MERLEAPGRELTLDEAVALAILLQQGGQFVEAEEVYRRVRSGSSRSGLQQIRPIQWRCSYNHRRDYVERVLAALLMDTTIAEADLRLKSGVPVAGLVVRAKKAAADF